jgi:hypothetical protein
LNRFGSRDLESWRVGEHWGLINDFLIIAKLRICEMYSGKLG